MSEGWKKTPLSNLLKPISRPETVNSSKIYSVLGAHWYAQGLYVKEVKPGSAIQATKIYRVEDGDFVYNRLFAWKGSFALADASVHNCYVSNEFPCFEVNHTLIVDRFLRIYFSQSHVWDEALSFSTGGTPTSRNRLKEKSLLALRIPLPPLAEQHRIVTRINELAAKIEEAKGLRQEATEEAETLLASASEKAFKPQTGWRVEAVNSFCDSPQYGFTASATQEPVGPKMLRITDIQAGQVNWESVPFCLCPTPETYLLQANDLVFARTGGTTGKSFVIRDCPKSVFASYLIRLRVRHTVSVDYLYRYFQTPSYWSQITDNKEGTGQPNMNGSKLSSLKVPIAPTLAEQSNIVAYLDGLQAKVDALKALQAETAAELDALLPSVLDRAFSGRL